MSVEQLKSRLVALSPEEQEEVSAFLYHLRHASDPENMREIRERLDDKDPTHWLTLDEFERRLGEQ